MHRPPHILDYGRAQGRFSRARPIFFRVIWIAIWLLLLLAIVLACSALLTAHQMYPIRQFR